MKHKKRHGSEEDESSSEDERIIEEEEEEPYHEEPNIYNEEDEIFENSQDLTQVVPRSNHDDTLPLDSSSSSHKSKKKKKKDKDKHVIKREKSPTPISAHEEEEEYVETRRAVSSAGRRNGFRVREVDETEIPEHIIKGLKRLQPKESDSTEGLTAEDWEACKTDEEGGVWILQCPKDVQLDSVIAGKKLSLDGKRSILGGEDDDDDLELTQYAPSSSLGTNITKRQFEAVSVSNEQYREGVALLLPDNNSFRLVTAPVKGHIIIRESLRDLHIPKLEVPEPKPRELPSGIKERHPVYGSDITQILREMEDAPVKKKKKKKSLPEPEPELGPPKFTKLTTKIQDNFNGSNEVNGNEDDSVSRKKKKKKKEKHREEEESFTDQSSLYLKEEEETPPTKSKKKKSKRKREEMEEEEPEDSKEHLQAILDCDMPPKKRSKKSKHHG